MSLILTCSPSAYKYSPVKTEFYVFFVSHPLHQKLSFLSCNMDKH